MIDRIAQILSAKIVCLYYNNLLVGKSIPRNASIKKS